VIVRLSECLYPQLSKIFRKNRFDGLCKQVGNPLTPVVPVSQLLHRVHQAVSSFPSTNQIRWTSNLDCLPEASFPGIIRQHWSWQEQRGHLCQTINSAYPPFVPPFTFPPVRLRQLVPYRSPRKQLSSKTYYCLCQAHRSFAVSTPVHESV
jgi:hypothetical protein